MNHHMIAFFVGFLLDLILGDPYCFPHPVRLIGKLITGSEKILRGIGIRGKDKKADDNRNELLQGIGLVIIVIISVVAVSSLLVFMAYWLHPVLGVGVECVMTYQILAVKCLKVESMKVYRCLKNGNPEQARKAVSMIVGRDTECLDEEGVAKAAIETVAENTSDGVIAPMLYLAIGGPIIGFLYKAINTMDSMIGYKNDKYLYFGRAAAKLDDFVNFLPARISAGLMISASFFAGRNFSGKGAWEIYKRDRRKHASPNSGQTEAVCAGALSIKLGGDASYFGRAVKKPYIGEAVRKVEYEDIKRVNHLMYITAWLCEVLCLLVMYAIVMSSAHP
ncbi:MAG: cobalamin biosynthesis protein CobD [Lachnospiraceae bacterium]|nr:cobalamin biosynthesis protein CobD [Lachnospiraceae bacterium]